MQPGNSRVLIAGMWQFRRYPLGVRRRRAGKRALEVHRRRIDLEEAREGHAGGPARADLARDRSLQRQPRLRPDPCPEGNSLRVEGPRREVGEALRYAPDQRAALVLLRDRGLAGRREQALFRFLQPRDVDRRRQDLPDEQPQDPSRLPRALDRPEGSQTASSRATTASRSCRPTAESPGAASRTCRSGSSTRWPSGPTRLTRSAAGSRTTTAGAALRTLSCAAASATPTGSSSRAATASGSCRRLRTPTSSTGTRRTGTSRGSTDGRSSRATSGRISPARATPPPAELKYRFNWTSPIAVSRDRRERGLCRRQRRLQVDRRRSSLDGRRAPT